MMGCLHMSGLYIKTQYVNQVIFLENHLIFFLKHSWFLVRNALFFLPTACEVQILSIQRFLALNITGKSWHLNLDGVWWRKITSQVNTSQYLFYEMERFSKESPKKDSIQGFWWFPRIIARKSGDFGFSGDFPGNLARKSGHFEALLVSVWVQDQPNIGPRQGPKADRMAHMARISTTKDIIGKSSKDTRLSDFLKHFRKM